MNKLTAEKCREMLTHFKSLNIQGYLLEEGKQILQALEIALPVLEQHGDFYIVLDNGQPYDVFADKAKAEYYAADASGLFSVIAVIAIPQPSTTTQIENDGWIEWGGGDNPAEGKFVQVEFRDGMVDDEHPSASYRWYHEPNNCDIVAYRVIENDGREG